MYKDKRILGLIPARGGSKGLPRKNVLPVLGKPLIAWTIEQGLASRYLDRLVVSTDDKEIAEISKQYGGEIPFLRPDHLAYDEVKSIDVILHALGILGKNVCTFDYVALLEPTSPLREASDIDVCVDRLIPHRQGKSIVSVARLEGAHPDFNVTIDTETGFIRNGTGGDGFKVLRRQELRDFYYFDGTIYLSEVQSLLERRTFYHELTLPYVVPKWKALEIDDGCDLICAESLLRARLSGKI
jgi:N-acylneuraminate cytidylyltransferase/CMP-N,N'-diacetyllegionaminic acid synthase